MQITSRYPSGRDFWATYSILQFYLPFILSIDDHSHIVFEDEKPMKEIDVYRLVRHDVLTGNTPTHEFNSADLKK